MALTRLTCPICLATLKPAQPVEEGTRVRCPKCKGAFVAEGERPAEEPVPEPTPAAVEDEEEIAEVEPADEDEADQPPRRRHREREDDEEEDDRPRKRAKKGGVPLWVWLVGGGVGLFLLCGGGGGGVLLFLRPNVLGGNVSLANYNQLKKGMSEPQVRAIMGTPTSTADIAGMHVDTWKNGDSFIIVSFANGKAIVGHCHITDGTAFVDTQGALP